MCFSAFHSKVFLDYNRKLHLCLLPNKCNSNVAPPASPVKGLDLSLCSQVICGLNGGCPAPAVVGVASAQEGKSTATAVEVPEITLDH